MALLYLIINKYSNHSIDERDLLKATGHEISAFGGIYDRAMLCALSASMRQSYITAIAARLNKSGIFFGIPFLSFNIEMAGPPFALSLEDMQSLFSEQFTLVTMETVNHSLDKQLVVLAKLLSIWRRRMEDV